MITFGDGTFGRYMGLDEVKGHKRRALMMGLVTYKKRKRPEGPLFPLCKDTERRQPSADQANLPGP